MQANPAIDAAAIIEPMRFIPQALG
jgi:hypothetical protein